MSPLFPLILGLVIFVTGHLVPRIPGVRDAIIARTGQNAYRGLYSLVALMGLAQIVHGFGVYRATGYIPVWDPPRAMTHLAMLLVWIALTLVIAPYFPGKIKEKAKHPMLAGVKLWAFAHLLVNGDLGSILLFGTILGWAVITRIIIKRQANAERAPGAPEVAGSPRNDLIAVAIGTALTFALIYGLHQSLFGVAILAK